MRLLFLFLFTMSSSVLMAQMPFVQDLWLNDNRTPVKANALMTDKNGYLIIGTDAGVYRYNGINFRLMKSNEKAPVTSLSFQQNKTWIGYKNGAFGSLENDSVAIFRSKDYKGSAAVNAVTIGPDKSIWLATEEGIVHIHGQRVIHFNSANGLPDDFIYTLDFIGNEKMIAGSDQGLDIINLASGKMAITTFSTGQGLQDNIARVVRNTGGGSGYWIGAQQGGISVYNAAKNRCSPLKITGGWKWGQVNDILPMSPERAYAATNDGYLLEMKLNGSDSAVVRAFSFPGKKINALTLDKSGNIWCATDNGISLVTAEYLDFIPLPKPFSLADVTAMNCDAQHQLWLALKQDVYRIDLNKENKTLLKIFHANEPVSVIYSDANNNVWLGTSGDGLWVKENTGNFKKVVEPSLAKESILSLTVAAGQLWLSGLNGVKQFYMDGSAIRLAKTHNKASGIGSDYIYQLFADSKGRVWMATDGAGVCMFDRSEYYHWNTFGPANNPVIYTITEDAGGSMWAGTLFKGLYRFKSGQWTNVRKKEVPDMDVNLSAINANGTGQVVAVYQRCIDMWYPGDKFFRHFNSRYNMGPDSTSQVLNCTAKDGMGNVYVPFEKGLLVFKNQFAKYSIKPGICISRISNNIHDDINVQEHEYGPGENYLSFYFEGISFTNPERLNYRFMLEGYNDRWINTNELSATFPKLPAGNFTFRVQVSLNGNFDHASEASFAFSIAAPLWQRPWFILLAMVLVFWMTYLIIRYRDRKLQRLATLEQEKVLFDYEHLKSQVNPHFLFNSLNTLTSLIEDNKQHAVTYTERLSDLYRNMLTYHNRDLISLGEEWEILSAYLYIQQSRFGKALQVQGVIPETLKSGKRIPPMALQLLVENAIKHNVVSVASPLVIEVMVDEKEITVSNKIKPKIRKETESGIGLMNIRNRYAMLTKRKVYYGKEGENWVVKLPLL